IEVHVIAKLDFLRMYLQDILASLQIRELHRNPPVKPAGTKQRRVKGIRPVGRRQNHNAPAPVKTIHLCEKLVQSLLTLIISAEARAVTLLSYGIDLVDKHDTRRFLIGLLEQVTH